VYLYIMEKRCNKCKEIKPVSEFGKEKRAKNGYKPRCKKCSNEYYNSVYYKYKENKAAHSKKYYSENTTYLRELRKTHKKPNPEHVRIIKKEWRKTNKDIINKKQREYNKNRAKIDPLYNIQRRTRSMIHKLMTDRHGNIESILGYTIKELINRIGLYENTEKHIDHKVPMSWFILGTDIRIINSLDNLQLLSISENVQKHNCFSHPISLEYYTLIKDHIKPKYLHLLKTNQNENR
jgi:hypothetical protein